MIQAVALPGLSAGRAKQDEYSDSFNVTKTGFQLMSPEILVKNCCYHDVF